MTKQHKPTPEPAANPGSKKDKVTAMLRRAEGASLGEITETTGWLPHTARAMLTGLRKSGLAITKDKVEGITRYAAGQAQ